mgnify:CR=1 FL=1
MMKLNRRHFTALAGASLLAAPAIKAHAADVTLKLGHLANEQNSWHKASIRFGEEVAKLTEGRVEVQVFPNESLGKEIDLINGMQLGTADMTITGESLQNWAPMAALLAIPYGYKTLEDMDAGYVCTLSALILKGGEAHVLHVGDSRVSRLTAAGPEPLTEDHRVPLPGDRSYLARALGTDDFEKPPDGVVLEDGAKRLEITLGSERIRKIALMKIPTNAAKSLGGNSTACCEGDALIAPLPLLVRGVAIHHPRSYKVSPKQH